MRPPLPALLIMAALATAGCADERRQLGQALSGKPPVINGSLVGRWAIADLNGGGPVAGALLEFADGGQISGSAGCNRITGRWQAGSDGSLGIGPLATTRRACEEPGMGIEDRVLALLGAVRRVEHDGRGNAALVAPDGRRLRLIPALPEPPR